MVSGMNDYSFGVDPRIKEIIELIQQAKQNQQQQEPPTGTQYADASFQKGNEARNAAWQQQTAAAMSAAPTPETQQATQAAAAMSAQPTPETQQAVQAIQQQPQQQPLTTPEQWRLMNQITEQKGIHEGADAIAKAANPQITDGAQLDAIANSLRTGAHNNADLIRQIAKETGIDLSGIEDVSYADAQRNLQTRQTKEVADILSGRGKYGRNSDQYYNDMYMQFISEGKSDRQAKRLAGQFAQRYQYDRVTYLRNAYNMYGRDGNYTNEDGVPILQEIAMEMPDVAGVYANAYKLPTHLQDRAIELENKAIAQANQLEQIDRTGYNNAQLQKSQGETNKELEGIRFGYRMAENVQQSNLRKDEAKWQSDLDFNKHVNTQAFDSELAIKQAYARYNAGLNIAGKIGLKGDEAKVLAAAFAGVQIPQKGGTMDNKSIENLTKIAKTYDESEKNILSQLEKGALNLSEQEVADLNEQLEFVRGQKAIVQQALFEISGIDSKVSDDGTSLNKDLEHDLPVLKGAYDEAIRRGYTHEQAIKILRQNMEKSGYAGTQIEVAIGSLAKR